MGRLSHPHPQQMLTWERNLRPFLTSQALSRKGPRLALVQGFQPPPPLERLIDFCGWDRLCPGVAGKVFDIGQARASAFSFSLSPSHTLPPYLSSLIWFGSVGVLSQQLLLGSVSSLVLLGGTFHRLRAAWP